MDRSNLLATELVRRLVSHDVAEASSVALSSDEILSVALSSDEILGAAFKPTEENYVVDMFEDGNGGPPN